MMTFGSTEVSEITGVNGKTLHHWDMTGLVSPSAQRAHGKGTRKRYGFNDLLAIRLITGLRDAGVSLQSLRKVADYIRRELGPAEDLGNVFLVTDGHDVYLRQGDSLVSALRERGQRLMFTV